MKVKITQDIDCPKCGKKNVKYHAKNMCKNCYMYSYLKAYRKRKKVSTVV